MRKERKEEDKKRGRKKERREEWGIIYKMNKVLHNIYYIYII